MSEPKQERIHLRVSRRQKRVIEAAARRRGQTLSALLREGAEVVAGQAAA